MSDALNTLLILIENQQKGHESQPAFMVGEQLKEIAEKEPAVVDLLVNDLQTDGMKLTDAAQKIKEYADNNRKGAKCFCVTPIVAEGILRKFYGLPERVDEKQKKQDAGYIDLSAFL